MDEAPCKSTREGVGTFQVFWDLTSYTSKRLQQTYATDDCYKHNFHYVLHITVIPTLKTCTLKIGCQVHVPISLIFGRGSGTICCVWVGILPPTVGPRFTAWITIHTFNVKVWTWVYFSSTRWGVLWGRNCGEGNCLCYPPEECCFVRTKGWRG